jgi:uncharacterized protein YjbI with pentapeptide repeats/membrane protein implicated in regulation of membrane protease activity
MIRLGWRTKRKRRQRSSRAGSWWWSALVIVLPVLTMAGLAVYLFWGVLDLDVATSTGKLDVTRTVLAVAAGTGALVTLVLARRRQWATEHDAAERRLTDLYVKAVEQLGSDKAPVRHGALYALERVAQDNPDHRQTVVDVLCAYLRAPFAPPPDKSGTHRLGGLPRSLRGTPARRTAASAAAARRAALTPPTPTAGEQERRQEREVRLTAQRILQGHLNPGPKPRRPVHTFWPDLDIDLTGAFLIDLDLSGCRINTARFDRATFTGKASFADATFTEASYIGAAFAKDAVFTEARFTEDASFTGATFTERAWFIGAAFAKDAAFTEATFTKDASFDGATFTDDAWFTGATFTKHTSFDRATFSEDAWFIGATFTERASFVGAAFAKDASFNGAAFAKDAAFIEARFIEDAWFNSAAFAKNALFTGATFAKSAAFNDATFTSFPSMSDVAHPLGTTSSEWPVGWTTSEISATRSSRSRPQLVPVPAVLPQLPHGNAEVSKAHRW